MKMSSFLEREAKLIRRVGDLHVNAYFGMAVGFCRKYQKDAGVGTVVAMVLPYLAASLAVWTVLLVLWCLLALPFGSQARGRH